MTDDLVKRLRFELRDWDGASRFHFPEVNALVISQAADRIEALTAENERLRTHLAAVRDEALEGAAEITQADRYAYDSLMDDPCYDDPQFAPEHFARHRQAAYAAGLERAADLLAEMAKATPLGHENIQRGGKIIFNEEQN